MKFGIFSFLLLTMAMTFNLETFAATSAGVTYSGRLLNPDGSAVEGVVQFRIQIRTPNTSNCLLFQETKMLDLTGKKGYFTLTLNDATTGVILAGSYPLDRVFANVGKFEVTHPNLSCGGSTEYIPNATDGRKLKVFFRDSTFAPSDWEELPAMDINFVPTALESVQVGGFKAAHLLRVQDASGVPQNVSPLSTSDFTTLVDLIDGVSNIYMKNSTVTGIATPVVSGVPSGATTGSVWFDSATGKLRYHDGTTAQTLGTSGGSVSSVAAGTGLTTGGSAITSTGTVSIADAGVDTLQLKDGAVTAAKLANSGVTANTYGSSVKIPVITVDSKGRLTLVTEADVTGLPSGTAGEYLKYSGGAWASARIEVADVKSSVGAHPSFFNFSASCTLEKTLVYDSINDRMSCTAIGINANQVTAGTLDKDRLPTDVVLNGGNSPSATMTVGTKTGQSLQLLTNDLPRVTVTDTGFFGIGTATPDKKLFVEDTVTGTSGGGSVKVHTLVQPSGATSSYWANNFLTHSEINSTVNIAGQVRSSTSRADVLATHTGNIANVTAINGEAYAYNNEGTITDLTGLVTNANTGANATGTFTRLTGVQTAALLGANTVATDIRGISTSVGVNAGSSATNGYAIYAAHSGTGTLTNGYGVYIGTLTGTKKWGFYSNNDAPNFFKGSLGLGITDPLALLHLKAGTAAAGTAPLKFTTGTLLTSVENGAVEYDGADLYLTSGGTRRKLASASVAGDYSNVGSVTGSGALTISAGGTDQNLILSGSGTGQVQSPSVVNITNSTASTSKTTGALVVNGGVGVDGTVNATSFVASSSATIPLIYGSSAPSGTLTLRGTSDVTSGNVIINTGGGNVGVGVATPAARLEVAGATLVDRSGNGTITNNQGAWTRWVTGSGNGYTNFINHRGAGSGGIRFSDTSDGATINDLVTITGTGHVGVSTTNPTHGLVYNTNSRVMSVAGNGLDNTSSYGVFSLANNRATPASGDVLGLFDFISANGAGQKIGSRIQSVASGAGGANGFGAYMSFQTKADNGSLTERMRIAQNGNVGIGTIAPAAALDVNGVIDVHNTTAVGANFYTHSDTDFRAPNINLFRSQGTQAAPTALGVMDYPLGGLQFGGYNGSNYVRGAIIQARSAEAWSATTNASNLVFYTNPTGATDAPIERMRITSSGNVGIGNATPTEALDIGSTGKILIRNPGSSPSGSSIDIGSPQTNPGITITRGDGSGNELRAWQMRVETNQSFVLQEKNVGQTTGAKRFTVLSGGNVGIGTAAPANLLSVVSEGKTSDGDSVSVTSYTTGSSPKIIFNRARGTLAAPTSPLANDYLGAVTGSGYDGTNFVNGAVISIQAEGNWSDLSKPGKIAFATNDGAAVGTRMTISSGGNVGIGTTSPSGALHVNGSPVLFQNSAGALRFHQNATANYIQSGVDLTGGSSKDFSIGNMNASSTWMTILGSSGNMGIGTTAPSEKLEVSGNVKVVSTATCILGTAAGGVNCTSDARLKDHVKVIPEALAKILQLRGVEFDWNKNASSPGRHDIGVIAQEVEKVFPTLIHQDKDTGYKMVDYAGLVSPLIESTKELYGLCKLRDEELKEVKREVASLKEQNARLNQENESLKQRLQRIEEKLGL